ncbi:hypothetical protein Pedsa_2963 [Pseudopedobacter saltans DSM 12145]|uniref:Uncharacterized protein n=1 Tax=Pseudopedobacter saltans (strain ATCC 51119 / DSM 12145 / JCM 21818 / CCUG 39354 / LMG 10337 / NBRC 100064 / NCIMB 13643) TaxID=762903 RepID=F0S915_PSESL|nr:hypothetical protein [Pseudopedobacter saltans]ADY53502.1 hypothetical protein Pedsa_2963 [Pseudopedobacter saltans DSM 12145]
MEYKRTRRSQKSPQKRFLLILGLTVSIVYFALGMVIIFWDTFPLLVGVEPMWKNVFAAFLIIYSLFRLVRVLQDKRDE